MPVVAPGRLPDRAYQLPDGTGFRFGGATHRGFRDRPDLPIEVRRQVARWATASGSATAVQRELAEGAPGKEARAGSTELMALLDYESGLLDDSRFRAALDRLSAAERRQILRPHTALGRTVAWPLTVHDAARVLEDVTENQLRDWDDAGVCPAMRWGKGRYRGYFRSQLLLARLVRNLLREGYGLDRIREDLGLSQKPTTARDVVAIAAVVSQRARGA